MRNISNGNFASHEEHLVSYEEYFQWKLGITWGTFSVTWGTFPRKTWHSVFLGNLVVTRSRYQASLVFELQHRHRFHLLHSLYLNRTAFFVVVGYLTCERLQQTGHCFFFLKKNRLGWIKHWRHQPETEQNKEDGHCPNRDLNLLPPDRESRVSTTLSRDLTTDNLEKH